MEVVAGMLTAAVFKFTEHIWLKGIAALGDYRLSVGPVFYTTLKLPTLYLVYLSVGPVSSKKKQQRHNPEE